MVCCLTAPSHHQVQSWPTGINNIYLCNTSQDMSLGLNELNYVMFLFKVKSQLIIYWWKGNDIDKQNKHECFILCNREFLSFNIRPYCRHACVKEIFYFVKEISVFSCSCYWSPPSQVGSPVLISPGRWPGDGVALCLYSGMGTHGECGSPLPRPSWTTQVLGAKQTLRPWRMSVLSGPDVP